MRRWTLKSDSWSGSLVGLTLLTCLTLTSLSLASNSVASAADVTILAESPSALHQDDLQHSEGCLKCGEESSRMLEQEGHGEVSPIQLLQEDQQHQNYYHSHHQGHIHLPLSTPLPLATPLIPIFLPKESQLLASRKKKDSGTSEAYSLSALLTQQEKHNYHMVEQRHEASKRIGKPMQLQGLENEKEQDRLTTKIREDSVITGVKPVTSIWHQRLPLAHKNTTQPDTNVDRSIISHLGSEPLYSRTLAGRNDETDVRFIGSLRFPPENISSTWNLGYGAVENNIRQSFPVIFGNADNSNNGQKFASVTRQAPFQTAPASYTPQSPIILGDSNTQQLSQPSDLSQLLRVVQLALSEDLKVKEYLSQLTSSPVPPVSFAPSTFGSEPFNSAGFPSSISPDQTAWQTAPSNNVIQFPQNYQNYAFNNVSIPYQEQDLLNDPVSPSVSNPENEPNYFGDEPYIPALGSPLDIPHFTNFDLKLTPDVTVIAQSPAAPVAASSSSIVAATTTSTSSVTGCLANSLCALLAATALALGASTAVALPFFTTGFFGRRKRNVDNSFLTPKDVTELVNVYISYIKNVSLNTPGSEHLFSGLLDPTNDSAREIFKNLEKQIIKNKDKLPNFILRETPLNGPIPNPEKEILAIINDTKTGGVPELSEGEVEDTLASEQGNTGARDVTHVHMTQNYHYGSNTLISSKPPAAAVQTLDTEYTHDNWNKQDLQDTGVATRSTMQPSTQHGSPYSPLNDQLKSSLAGVHHRPYASNDLRPPKGVRILDSLRSSALQSLPLNYYSSPLPKYAVSAAPRTHDDPGMGMFPAAQSQGITGGPLRPKTATFYRTVCGALDPHTTDNDIIKFIASKCSILQRVGII